MLGVALIVGVPEAAAEGRRRRVLPPEAQSRCAAGATASAEDDDAIVPEATPSPAEGRQAASQRTYDFYTLLPSNEVALSDAELAETERAEAERQREAQQQAKHGDPRRRCAPTSRSRPIRSDASDRRSPAAATRRPRRRPSPKRKDDGARYLLQAGAFQASGDAEAVKAKIAMLGLSARVESAQIADKTVFRVRMGPYGSASELADAKRRLGSGGLPAMAIKAR